MRASTPDRIRREPRQHRSRETVRAVLEAVPRILQRDGVDGLTTNHIAETAGVSIGSLYQYFPDKTAIFTALHDRHVDDVHRVFEQTLAVSSARILTDTGTDTDNASPLDAFTGALVAGLCDLHAHDRELHELVAEHVPGSALGFRRALRATFARVTSSERALFVLPTVIEGLVHAIPQRRRGDDASDKGTTAKPLTFERAREDAVQTALTCLASCAQP